MRVPVLDGPQVQPAAMPVPRAQLDTRGAYGEAIGEGLQQLGGGLEQVARHEKEQADAAAVTDAETQLQGTINSALYDRDKGVLNARGEAAVAASGGVYDAVSQVRGKLAASLQNDDQRRIFMMRSGGLLQDVQRTVERHVGEQIQVAKQASLKGRADVALDAIANGYSDPDAVARQEAAVEGPIRALALSKEDADAKVADWHSQVTATRLNQYLANKDFAGAQALFAAQKDRLGAQAPQFEHQISALGDAVQSDQQAQTIVDSARIDGYPWVNESKALAALDALPPGRQKDETRQRVEHQLELNQRIKAQAGKDHLDQLQSIFQKTGNANDPSMAPIRAWMVDPENGATGYLEQFDRQVRADQRADRYAKEQDRAAQRQADREAYYDYMSRPLEERVKLDVDHEDDFADASTGGRARIKAQQQKDGTAIGKGAAEGEAEFLQDLKSQAELAGFANDKAKVKDFLGVMGAWRQQQLLDTNKPPSRKDVRDKVTEMLTIGDPGFFSADKFRFEYGEGEQFERAPDKKQRSPLVRGVPPTSSASAPAPTSAPTPRAPANLDEPAAPAGGEVPPAERDLIVKAYAKAKRPAPTDEQIRAIYAKHKGAK